MAAMAVAKLLLCCDIICKCSIIQIMCIDCIDGLYMSLDRRLKNKSIAAVMIGVFKTEMKQTLELV